MRNWQMGPIIGFALLISSIVGLVQPSLTNTSLFHPEWSQEFLQKWILVFVFVAAIYMIVLQYIYRNTPITVISTDLTVTFGPDGSATFVREQLLRANQPRVTAYMSKHGPSSPNGKVDQTSITARAFCNGWHPGDSIELRTIGGTVEALHLFTQPLPFKWYMPLIPTWILNREPERLFSFVRKNVVKRHDKMRYETEFNVEKPMMNFTQAGRYQHLNLSIRLEFGAVQVQDFKVREIQNNGVIELQHEQDANNVRVVRVDKMTTGIIRITWTPVLNPVAA
jgi:hypothetical protein